MLLERTEARLEDIQREIDGLRLKRKDVETSIEATINTLRNTLDYVREQDDRERDDNILLHRPRQSDQDERTCATRATRATESSARADSPRSTSNIGGLIAGRSSRPQHIASC